MLPARDRPRHVLKHPAGKLDHTRVDGGREARRHDLGVLSEEGDARSALVHELDHHDSEDQDGEEGSDDGA